jgi:hypothetical protein
MAQTGGQIFSESGNILAQQALLLLKWQADYSVLLKLAVLQKILLLNIIKRFRTNSKRPNC